MTAGEYAVTVERDLTYATVDGEDLRLDIYRPAEPGAPVVVYAHGGGWSIGDKVQDGPKRLAPLAAYGVTVVSVDYRLAPRAVFPSNCTTSKEPCAGCGRMGRASGSLPTGSGCGVLRQARTSGPCWPCPTATANWKVQSAATTTSPAQYRLWCIGSGRRIWQRRRRALNWRRSCCRSGSRQTCWARPIRLSWPSVPGVQSADAGLSAGAAVPHRPRRPRPHRSSRGGIRPARRTRQGRRPEPLRTAGGCRA